MKDSCGRCQPIETDFKGSSLKVETGGDLGLSGSWLRLAQREMRAAKRHHGAEAQRAQSRQHAR